MLGRLQALKESGACAEAPTIVVYPTAGKSMPSCRQTYGCVHTRNPNSACEAPERRSSPFLSPTGVGQRRPRCTKPALSHRRQPARLYPVHGGRDCNEAAMIAASAPWTQQVPHGDEVVVPPSPREIVKARSLIVETRSDRTPPSTSGVHRGAVWAGLEEIAH